MPRENGFDARARQGIEQVQRFQGRLAAILACDGITQRAGQAVEDGAGEDEKVIVRSNGTVTYVGKDIAYQMWKFGLLGRDFDYAPFDWTPGEPLYPVWTTTSASSGRPSGVVAPSSTRTRRGEVPPCRPW